MLSGLLFGRGGQEESEIGGSCVGVEGDEEVD